MRAAQRALVSNFTHCAACSATPHWRRRVPGDRQRQQVAAARAAAHLVPPCGV